MTKGRSQRLPADVIMIAAKVVLMIAAGDGLASTIACQETGSQMEINRCSKDDYEASKVDLDKELRQLEMLLEGQPRELQLLGRSQSAWLKFVDSEMALRFPSPDGKDPVLYFGSMYWSEYFGAKAAIVRERIVQLRETFRMMPGWLETRDVADQVPLQRKRT